MGWNVKMLTTCKKLEFVEKARRIKQIHVILVSLVKMTGADWCAFRFMFEILFLVLKQKTLHVCRKLFSYYKSVWWFCCWGWSSWITGVSYIGETNIISLTPQKRHLVETPIIASKPLAGPPRIETVQNLTREIQLEEIKDIPQT
jgi:hypothetical protein